MTISETSNAGTSAPSAAPVTAAAPVAAPAPAPSSPVAREMTAEEVLRFDPFAESDKGNSDLPANGAGGEGGDQTVDETTAPVAQPPVATPTAPVAENPELALVRKQLEDAQAIIAGRSATVPNNPDAPAQLAHEQIPNYDFTLNDELIGAINSGEPQALKTGLGAICKGVAQSVHKSIMQSLAQSYGPHLMQQIMQGMQVQQQQQQVQADFYGAYPELNQPAIRAIVLQTAEELSRQLNVNEYTPQFRDTVAQRVKALLGQAVPKPTQVIPSAPFMMSGSGARPAGQSNEEKAAQAIKDFFT